MPEPHSELVEAVRSYLTTEPGRIAEAESALERLEEQLEAAQQDVQVEADRAEDNLRLQLEARAQAISLKEQLEAADQAARRMQAAIDEFIDHHTLHPAQATDERGLSFGPLTLACVPVERLNALAHAAHPALVTSNPAMRRDDA